MRPRLLLPYALGVVSLSTVACVDPVHDAQVTELGGEAPGVPPGPNHRPGQPCLRCHGGEGPASAQFSLAGTVVAVQGQPDPAVNIPVQIEDIDGGVRVFTTNAAGNFYVPVSEWQPRYPLRTTLPSPDPTLPLQQMTTPINRDGSCAECHRPYVSSISPGPVYVALDAGTMMGVSP